MKNGLPYNDEAEKHARKVPTVTKNQKKENRKRSVKNSTVFHDRSRTKSHQPTEEAISKTVATSETPKTSLNRNQANGRKPTNQRN